MYGVKIALDILSADDLPVHVPSGV
jgi:hypothetical protein